MPHRPSR